MKASTPERVARDRQSSESNRRAYVLARRPRSSRTDVDHPLKTLIRSRGRVPYRRPGDRWQTVVMAQRDWLEWHQPYEDSASPLAGRLRVVQHYVVDFLDTAPPGEISVVSMCAGQGRDLLEVLTRHPRTSDVAARLVELDPRNAKVAMDAVATAGLERVEVVTGDAAITTAYEGMVPCDLVLACGVFGHAKDGDMETIIGHLPSLCAPGATVIWTRGALGSDLRPTIRRWFLEAGFDEIGFTTGEGGWGVGANRLVVAPQPYRAGIRLFTFVDELPSR